MDEKDVIVEVTGVSGSIFPNLGDSEANVDKGTTGKNKERTPGQEVGSSD